MALIAISASMTAACAQRAGPGTIEDVISSWRGIANPHPLLGHVYDARGRTLLDGLGMRSGAEGARLGVARLLQLELSAAGMLLLGEVHDNPEHHRLRSFLVEGRRALVMEHLRADQQAGLADFEERRRSGAAVTAADFFRAVEWERSGWPEQALFEPLITAALRDRMPILAGDPPRAAIRSVAREGAKALPEGEEKRLRLDAPLDPRLQDALLTELEASHCGLVPKAAFGNMALAQRYRDAHLADALIRAHATHGSVVLVAGNGHARKDRGVPYQLGRLAPSVTVLTLLLVEVEDGKAELAAYGPRGPDGKLAADCVIFTPRQSRPDPCEAMRSGRAR
jgi:uncharacterized iron-regulated protein